VGGAPISPSSTGEEELLIYTHTGTDGWCYQDPDDLQDTQCAAPLLSHFYTVYHYTAPRHARWVGLAYTVGIWMECHGHRLESWLGLGAALQSIPHAYTRVYTARPTPTLLYPYPHVAYMYIAQTALTHLTCPAHVHPVDRIA